MVHSYPSEIKHPAHMAQLYLQRHTVLVVAICGAIVLIVMIGVTLASQASVQHTQLEINTDSTPQVTSPLLLEKPLILNLEQSDNVTMPASSRQSQANTTQPKSSIPTLNDSVQINGKSVTVPKNGEVHKEIRSSNGKTTIDISVQSNSSTSNSSSLDLNVQSSTESTRQVGQ